MRFSGVIVAAGAGLRAGGAAPKQWREVAGKPMVRWSAEALLAAGCEEVVLVVPRDGGEALAEQALGGLPRWRAVPGGSERIDSVRAGLAAVSADAEAVLIHDAARPFLARRHIDALLEALQTHDGALPGLAVSDTLKRADTTLTITETAPREGLWRAQTPQAFRRDAILAAYAAWPGGVPTDDAAVLEAAGGRIKLTPGDPALMKVTFAEDFPMAELLAGQARSIRVGQGFDAHIFGPGSSLWLCGVEIAHTQTLLAHSDGDVGLHALTDALLGAIAEGDIGDHFPPTDPKWKDARSDQFLLHAVELAAAKGARVVNADVTVICERPKVKPHREAMRAKVAELLGLPLDRVSVKATTMEKMGFTGREEGMVASAVVSVEAPA